jgi:hypothetical protein
MEPSEALWKLGEAARAVASPHVRLLDGYTRLRGVLGDPCILALIEHNRGKWPVPATEHEAMLHALDQVGQAALAAIGRSRPRRRLSDGFVLLHEVLKTPQIADAITRCNPQALQERLSMRG